MMGFGDWDLGIGDWNLNRGLIGIKLEFAD